MEILLVRFHEANGTRRFAFDCVAADRSRTKVIVSADVALARKYDIRLQELPLLCRRLLDTVPQEALPASITLTEDHMIAIQAAARNVVEKKAPKPPRPSSVVGQAWRTSHPFNSSKVSATATNPQPVHSEAGIASLHETENTRK